ncbi:hypothetical protein CRUP_012480, partial [Coryphaenoides rupestris]
MGFLSTSSPIAAAAQPAEPVLRARPGPRCRSQCKTVVVISGGGAGTARMSGGAEQADILTVLALVKERWKV